MDVAKKIQVKRRTPDGTILNGFLSNFVGSTGGTRVTRAMMGLTMLLDLRLKVATIDRDSEKTLILRTIRAFLGGAALCLGVMVLTAVVLFIVSLNRAHPVATSTTVICGVAAAATHWYAQWMAKPNRHEDTNHETSATRHTAINP